MTTTPARRTRKANGENSIYEGADGKWHAWVTIGTKPDGSADRRHRMAGSRREVMAKVKDLERLRDNTGLVPFTSSMSVAAYLNQWLATTATARLRPRSLQGYGVDIRKHIVPAIGGTRLERLTTRQIEAFYAEMASRTRTDQHGHTRPAFRPETINHVHRTLRSALQDALRDELIPRNPAATARRPRPAGIDGMDYEANTLTADEARRLIDVAREQENGLRFILALSHGLRQGEALGLTWRDVDLDTTQPQIRIRLQLQRHPWNHGCTRPDSQGTPTPTCGRKRACDCPTRHGGGLVLSPTKTRRGQRPLALDPITADLMRRHREAQRHAPTASDRYSADQDLVFRRPDGMPIDPKADHKRWKRLLSAADVGDHRLHDARHTAATFLLVQGVDSRVVMALLGWSNPSQLHRYQHIVDDLRRDAAHRMASILHPPTQN